MENIWVVTGINDKTNLILKTTKFTLNNELLVITYM